MSRVILSCLFCPVLSCIILIALYLLLCLDSLTSLLFLLKVAYVAFADVHFLIIVVLITYILHHTAHDNTWYQIMSFPTTIYHTKSHNIILNRMTWYIRHTMSYQITWYHITSHHILSYCMTSYHSTQHFITSKDSMGGSPRTRPGHYSPHTVHSTGNIVLTDGAMADMEGSSHLMVRQYVEDVVRTSSPSPSRPMRWDN